MKGYGHRFGDVFTGAWKTMSQENFDINLTDEMGKENMEGEIPGGALMKNQEPKLWHEATMEELKQSKRWG